jgi:antitoxin StbD
MRDGNMSISDFKKSPNGTLKAANDQPVAVLTNGRISGYYISPEMWETINDTIEDIELAKIARSRMKGKRVRVDLDAL